MTLSPPPFYLLIQIFRNRLSGFYCNGNLFFTQSLDYRSSLLKFYIMICSYSFFCIRLFFLIIYQAIYHIIIGFCSGLTASFKGSILIEFLIMFQTQGILSSKLMNRILWNMLLYIFMDFLPGFFIESLFTFINDCFSISI